MMRTLIRTTLCSMLGACSAIAAPHYSADFQGEVGAEWSARGTAQTASKKRRFLGPFGNEVVGLKLTGLPGHRVIRLRFDLLVIGSWSGNVFAGANNQIIGPDQWGVDAGQRVLLHTTFSNQHWKKAARQAYPGAWGQFAVKAGTGAAEQDTLGYTHRYAEGVKPADSVYRIEVVFPHTGPALALQFYGLCLARRTETWGIDNLTVQTLARSPYGKTDRGSLRRQYQALMGKDAAAAQRARWALGCAGDEAVALLRALLVRTREGQRHQARIAALITQLGAPAYRTRQAASVALSRLGPLAAGQLRAALEARPVPEVRWRLEALLERIRRAKLEPSAAQRTRQRALAVLSIIGGPQATALITRVTGSPAGAAALVSGSHWKGLCLQDGYPSYTMGLEITRRTGNRIWGKIHWLVTNNSKTLWRGKIEGQRVIFQEYQLIQGSGIIVPCDYQLRIVGQRLIGPWIGGGQLGSVQLRPAADSTGNSR